MRYTMSKLLLLTAVLFLSACQINDKPAQSFVMSDSLASQKQFIIVGASRYTPDITVAFFKEGIKIKPIAITEEVKELKTESKIVEYKQAGYRYLLMFDLHQLDMVCVKDGRSFVQAKISVIDIDSNETLAVIEHEGPVSDCATLTSTWTILAKEFAKITNTEN